MEDRGLRHILAPRISRQPGRNQGSWSSMATKAPSPRGVFSYTLPIATVAFAIAIFVIQTFTNVDIDTLYVVVVWMAARFFQPRGVLLAALGCAGLTVLSLFLGPPPPGTLGLEVGNEFIRLTAIGVTALFATDRRRAEENLRQARDHENKIRNLNQELAKRAAELEATNKELEAFSYSVSHDLRAPLRHVAGYAELLQKQASDSLDDKSHRYIRTIVESAKRMGDLIDDLLAFSKIGRAETKKMAVDLQQLVKEVLAEIGEETKGRDIMWKIGALPICYGDRSMLRVVMVNLVSNAVKYTRMRKSAEIEIGCQNENENEIEIFVRDNGAGFDMRYVDKLFGIFQRLHLPEQFEGTGIGLATVQRIIHHHGGKVRCEGAIDEGATFYFSLPKVQHAYERTANTP